MSVISDSLKSLGPAFCINVDSATERWAEAKAEFDRLELAVKRFSGVVPDTLPKLRTPSLRRAAKLGYIRGQYGCFLSHKSLIEYGLNQGFESMLVFEDDICFYEDQGRVEMLTRAVAELPDDWDLFLIGFRPKSPVTRISKNLARINGPYRCTHGYAIRRKAMNGVSNMEPDCIDTAFSDYLVENDLNVYTPAGMVTTQRDGYSQITNRMRSHTGVIHTSWKKYFANGGEGTLL